MVAHTKLASLGRTVATKSKAARHSSTKSFALNAGWNGNEFCEFQQRDGPKNDFGSLSCAYWLPYHDFLIDGIFSQCRIQDNCLPIPTAMA